MKKKLLIALSIMISSCGAGVSDYVEDLGNGYTYESFGRDLKNIRSPLPNQKSIFGTVVQYARNKDFILAIQVPNRDVYRGALAFELRISNRSKYKNNSEADIHDSEKIADSLIQCSAYYKNIFARNLNYWIIYHTHKKIFGPLTKTEYIAKRKELKVPDDLKLEQENQ